MKGNSSNRPAIGIPKIAFTFAGCFLGAGYVSGQELWQFFGAFGSRGLFGLVISLSLLVFLGTSLSYIVSAIGATEMDRVLVPWQRGSVLRKLSGVMQLILLFGVAAIMFAGGGAMLHQLFGIPAYLGSAVMTVFVVWVALHGLKGAMDTFSLLVPIMTLMTVVFGVLAVSRYGFAVPISSESAGGNPLLRSWVIGCFSFSFYNLFGSVGVLTPLAEAVGDVRRAGWGILLGSTLLLPIALSVLLSLAAYPAATDAELPMLALAYSLSRLFGLIYGVLLFFSMFGTAVSMTVAITSYICKKWDRISEKRTRVVPVLGALAYTASLGGFGDLISVIYPLFGYCSSIFIFSMILYRIRLKKMKNGNKDEANSVE